MNKILYTPLYIEGRVKLINRFYNPSIFKLKSIIPGKLSSLRNSKE
jgi:hypothetical protein